MPLSLFDSIRSFSPSMTTPRYSMRLCSNVHLLGFRKKDCSSSKVSTSWTTHLWSSRSSTVAMRMSSMYTKIILGYLSLSGHIIRSITRWKVLGALHCPKSMTRGSYSPSGVLNVAFHWSPSWIRMLWYPHHMSNLVKRTHPSRFLVSMWISGSGYTSRVVHLFSFR